MIAVLVNGICIALGAFIAIMIIAFLVSLVTCTRNAFKDKGHFFSHYKRVMPFVWTIFKETLPTVLVIFIIYFVLYLAYTAHIELFEMIRG